METQNNIFKIENTGLLNSLAFIALPKGSVYVYLEELPGSAISNCNYEVFSPNFFKDESWQNIYLYKQKYVYRPEELIFQLNNLIIELEKKLPAPTDQSVHLSNLAEALRSDSKILETTLLSQYEFSFQQIMNEIKKGDLQKAVPTLAVEVSFRLDLLQKILMLKNIVVVAMSDLKAFGYGHWTSNGEGIIGITPEVLFEKKSDNYSTMALAGTLPLQSDVSFQDLLKDAKNLKEHEFVVKDICNKLKIRTTNIKINKTQVVQFRSLLHLKTDIEFSYQNNEQPNFKNLIEELHPTSALGVFAKSFDFSWLKNLPCQKKRKKFGAPIYFKLDDNHEIALVTLRNIQWTEFSVTLESGGGVVEGSKLEVELAELEKKRTVALQLILGAM